MRRVPQDRPKVYPSSPSTESETYGQDATISRDRCLLVSSDVIVYVDSDKRNLAGLLITLKEEHSLSCPNFRRCCIAPARPRSRPWSPFQPSHPTGPQQWGVYLLVWEKEGQRPAVYVVTGTNSTLGIKPKFNNYDKGQNLSVGCENWTQKGYLLTHKALVCTSPLPPPKQTRCTLRAVFKVLETTVSSSRPIPHQREERQMGGGGG